MRIRHLASCDFQRERWRNGAGWTRQVLRVPEGPAPFQWRASIAEFDADALFSPYPGYRRDLVLLAGEGCVLRFADGREVALDPPHGRTRFDGADVPHCRVRGRVEVFNLISSTNDTDVGLLHRPLVGPMVFFPEAQVSWLALLLSGQAQFPDLPDAPRPVAGDALLLQPEPERPERVVLSGGGELLLARITARDAARGAG